MYHWGIQGAESRASLWHLVNPLAAMFHERLSSRSFPTPTPSRERSTAAAHWRTFLPSGTAPLLAALESTTPKALDASLLTAWTLQPDGCHNQLQGRTLINRSWLAASVPISLRLYMSTEILSICAVSGCGSCLRKRPSARSQSFQGRIGLANPSQKCDCLGWFIFGCFLPRTS